MGKNTSDTKCPGHMTDISLCESIYRLSCLFIKCSLCTGHCFRHWRFSSDKTENLFLNVLLRSSLPSEHSQYNSECHK